MPRKRYSTEQIVTKLRQTEVELSRGLRTPQVCKKQGVSEQTYYRWQKEYGGLRLDQAKRFKELKRENTQLKKLVADQALDSMTLKVDNWVSYGSSGSSFFRSKHAHVSASRGGCCHFALPLCRGACHGRERGRR